MITYSNIFKMYLQFILNIEIYFASMIKMNAYD